MALLHEHTNFRTKHNQEVNIMARSNRLINQQAEAVLDQLKNDIAQGFGVSLGGETSSRQNGSVGGEMTKRLVQYGEQHISRV